MLTNEKIQNIIDNYKYKRLMWNNENEEYKSFLIILMSENQARQTASKLFSTFAPVALDVVVALASQAYDGRAFSVCTDTRAGRRNRNKH